MGEKRKTAFSTKLIFLLVGIAIGMLVAPPRRMSVKFGTNDRYEQNPTNVGSASALNGRGR